MNCLDFMSSERQTSGVGVRAALPRPGRVLQLIHINLRDPLLSTTNKDSMRESIQSLYHDLITGSKDLPLIPFKGTFCSCQTATPFIDMEQEQGENTTLSPLMKAASYMMVPTAGSAATPTILTPVLPERTELGGLMADCRNCVRSMVVHGRNVRRVISPDSSQL